MVAMSEINVGDVVVLRSSKPLREDLWGRTATVIKKDSRENNVHFDIPEFKNPRKDRDHWILDIANIAIVNPEPTQEEIEKAFGIKREEELKADAQRLIGMANATVVRLEARELRIEVEADNPNNDRWKEVVEAKNEVKLARAAALELEADYIEKYGLQTFRKDFF